jgi:hypothetical protein
MDGTVTQKIERARAYLAEVRARDLPDEPPIIRARVAGELLRHGEALLGIVDDNFLPVPAAGSAKGRAAAALLAEVPESQRATQERDRDAAWAVSTLVASLGDDTAATVTSWLRAVRREGLTGPQRETLAKVFGDAIGTWQREASAHCDDCENSAADLCDTHAADLDRADSYRALGRELGIEVSGS